jgi:signal peptidase I
MEVPTPRSRPVAAAFAVLGAGAFALGVAARRARLEPVRVAGRSMTPTLPEGALLAVGPMDGPPARGQLVVVRAPGSGLELVKRVVGLPGERVRLAGGRLEIDGRVVPEPYLAPAVLEPPPFEVDLGAGEYLVLGDLREASTDGREFGPVSSGALVARVRFAYWPPSIWDVPLRKGRPK